TTVSGNVTTVTVGTLASSSRLFVGENGSSTLTITGLETFNNSGLIDMVNGGTTDHIIAAGTNYNATNLSQMNINPFLGAGVETQSNGAFGGTGCAANATFADCMVVGAVTGTGTQIQITDTNPGGSGMLDLKGTVLVHGTSGLASDFTLGGSNVVATQQCN